MRKAFSLLVIFFIAFRGDATTYYVSAKGNDAVNGKSPSTPWETINKLNAFRNLKPGDSVLFKRGELFYGTLVINASRIIGNVIFYGSYGTGANPIITGFTSVISWTNLGGNIWESTNAVSTLSTCNMVVINGVNTPMGRYPNTGYLTFQSHSGSTSITSSSLPSSPNWTGAELVVRSSQWTLDRSSITFHSDSTLTFNPPLTHTPNNGFGYFIQNDSRTLDTTNEWYYNPSTKKIRIYSTISPTNVQVSSLDILVLVHGSNITFNNITFQGANRYAFFNDWLGMSNLNIQNCSILFSGIDAIKLANFADFKIENSTILNSNDDGINLFFVDPYSIIRNNTIQNTGIYSGMGQNGFGTYSGIFSIDTGLIAEYNRIINTGYIGIIFKGDLALIKNNLIDTFCTILQDGGGIYTSTSIGVKHSRKITGNIVLNGKGAIAGTNSTTYIPAEGIYLDDNSANIEVSNNSVANCANHGIFVHNASNLDIHDNTFYNNKIQLGTSHDGLGGAITGVSVHKNIFFSKSASQSVGYFSSKSNDITSVGTFYSNYYVRPMDDNLIFHVKIDLRTPEYNYNLEEWQSYSGQDADSKKSPNAITDVNDLRFEYNATSFNKTISLGTNYTDVTGKSYPGTITLAPYSSAVLIRNSAITRQLPKPNAGLKER